ncbi:tripartite tricarboxylate transporter TctB family protein [Pigmentiphaga aceris]|uniref:tripartite tricarboxylate transporter TctB family protein n=1 Tax=Pigmentiphaga aceris TaxID=1940612 RepID=UPI001652B237|nr:tripartite tricarboxylate transporter TctB family protein [Pigmentiphaga aceris]
MSTDIKLPTKAPAWRPPAIVGTILLVLAIVIWRDVARLPAAQAVGVGPAAGMRLVAGLLLILAIAHGVVVARALIAGRAGGAQPAASIDGQPPAERSNVAALAWALGGLIGMIVVLQVGGGFVIGATLLFAATAKAFGKPVGVRSIGIGLILAVVVYAFFTEALSLSLPAGPLEQLFQA